MLKDGTFVEEDIQNQNWTQMKDKVVSLELNNDGQIIKLPSNMPEYIQGKTASGDIISGKCSLESRYIGWKNGSNIVKIRVDEKTNNIKIEVE